MSLNDPTPTNSDYMMLRLVVQDAVRPLVDRLEKLESKLDDLDERYYRKDYLDQRFAPLEEASITKNQRLGMIVSAAAGAVSLFFTLLHNISIK